MRHWKYRHKKHKIKKRTSNCIEFCGLCYILKSLKSAEMCPIKPLTDYCSLCALNQFQSNRPVTWTLSCWHSFDNQCSVWQFTPTYNLTAEIDQLNIYYCVISAVNTTFSCSSASSFLTSHSNTF